jgi:hypothetical protein
MLPSTDNMSFAAGVHAGTVIKLSGGTPAECVFTVVSAPAIVDLRPGPSRDRCQDERTSETVFLNGEPWLAPELAVTPAPPPPGATVVDLRPAPKHTSGGTVVVVLTRPDLPMVRIRSRSVRPRPRARSRRRARRATASSTKAGGDAPPGAPRPGHAAAKGPCPTVSP